MLIMTDLTDCLTDAGFKFLIILHKLKKANIETYEIYILPIQMDLIK